MDNNIVLTEYNWIIIPNKSKLQYGIAISNVRIAQDHLLLKQQGFGAVLSIFGQKDLQMPSEVKHLRILVGDRPHENIKCFFSSTTSFIQQHLKKTNVLVHCQAGVSRSTSVVAAYLMKKNHQTYDEVIEDIRKKRPQAYPNKGFVKQLKQYQTQLENNRKIKENDFCSIF